MEPRENSKPFQYWKYSWQKWMLLIAGCCQLLSLWLNIREYQDILRVSTLIFSEEELQIWTSQMVFRCFLNGTSVVLFFSICLIGRFCTSARCTRLAEGILLLILALSCTIAGFVFGAGSSKERALVCFLLAAVSLTCGVYQLCRGKASV